MNNGMVALLFLWAATISTESLSPRKPLLVQQKSIRGSFDTFIWQWKLVGGDEFCFPPSAVSHHVVLLVLVPSPLVWYPRSVHLQLFYEQTPQRRFVDCVLLQCASCGAPVLPGLTFMWLHCITSFLTLNLKFGIVNYVPVISLLHCLNFNGCCLCFMSGVH